MDIKQASIEVRNLLTEQSPALAGLAIPRIQAILKTSLEDYARNSFADARKRQLFKQKVTVTFSAGEADLNDFLDGTESKISLSDLPRTTIYKESDNKPFTWVGSREQLFYSRVGSLDSPAIYLDGSILYTRNNEDDENDSFASDAYFTLPVYPSEVSDIPKTLEQDFIAFSADFIRRQFQIQESK